MKGFNVLSYVGNRDFVDLHLQKIARTMSSLKTQSQHMKMNINMNLCHGYFIGIEYGFVTSFLGVCCAIFFNKNRDMHTSNFFTT